MKQENNDKHRDVSNETSGTIPTVDMIALILMMNISKEDFIINVSFGEEAYDNE